MFQADSLVRVPATLRSLKSVLLASLVLAPFPALAGDAPSLLDDSFYVALGTFILNSDTEVSLNGDVAEGTPVDWEQTFGDNDVTRVRLDGYWRFGDSGRHKVRAVVFSASRKDSGSIDEDIEWGDVTYPANVELKGETGFDVIELAYEYAFLRRDKYELTGTIGLHYTNLSLTLTGEGTINGETPVSGTIREKGSVGAPLPVIGLRGLWSLSHDFWLDVSAQIFALSIDEYDGNLQDYRLALVWQPKKWAGLGLGYNRFKVDVDVSKSNFDGSLNWSYDGPMIFYSASF